MKKKRLLFPESYHEEYSPENNDVIQIYKYLPVIIQLMEPKSLFSVFFYKRKNYKNKFDFVQAINEFPYR